MTTETSMLRVAAVQMVPRLGQVADNLQKAERLVDEAFGKGAELVVLPEFFTSGMGFHPSLIGAALPFKGKAYELLVAKARQHGGPVGGSYISIKEDGERYNTFVLALPDGSSRTHDKDLPTMWENCYYLGGHDDGVMDTPLGPLGAALCWELVRVGTARRLRGRVRLLLAGTGWWDLPEGTVPIPRRREIQRRNLRILHDTPSTMSRLIGAPVVHAALAGPFTCRVPLLPGLAYRSRLLGEAQIVDRTGAVVQRMAAEQGDGVIVAPLELVETEPTLPLPDRFWIPELPPLIEMAWQVQNRHGRLYYRLVTRRAAGG